MSAQPSLLPPIPARHEYRLVGLLLLTVYAVHWPNLPIWGSQILLALHFLLFLLWQPLYNLDNFLSAKKLLLSVFLC